jgi:sec-independent protein translocase protein TatB
VLALLIIGPERLPGAARTAGYWVGRARRYIEGVRNEVEQEFDLSEFKRLMHNQEIQINELQRKLSGKLDDDVLTPPAPVDDALSKYDFHDDPIEIEHESSTESSESTDSGVATDAHDDKKDKPLT